MSTELINMDEYNSKHYKSRSIRNIIKKIHNQEKMSYDDDITKGRGKSYGKISKLERNNERNIKQNRNSMDMIFYSDSISVQTSETTFDIFPSSNGPHIFITKPNDFNEVDIIDLNVVNKLEQLNNISK